MEKVMKSPEFYLESAKKFLHDAVDNPIALRVIEEYFDNLTSKNLKIVNDAVIFTNRRIFTGSYDENNNRLNRMYTDTELNQAIKFFQDGLAKIVNLDVYIQISFIGRAQRGRNIMYAYEACAILLGDRGTPKAVH